MGPLQFITTSARFTLRGGKAYWTWIALLVALIVWGGLAYLDQLRHGLIVTNMRDQVSWAFYIGNFTFLVGVAAAAGRLAGEAGADLSGLNLAHHREPLHPLPVLGDPVDQRVTQPAELVGVHGGAAYRAEGRGVRARAGSAPGPRSPPSRG